MDEETRELIEAMGELVREMGGALESLALGNKREVANCLRLVQSEISLVLRQMEEGGLLSDLAVERLERPE